MLLCSNKCPNTRSEIFITHVIVLKGWRSDQLIALNVYQIISQNTCCYAQINVQIPDQKFPLLQYWVKTLYPVKYSSKQTCVNIFTEYFQIWTIEYIFEYYFIIIITISVVVFLKMNVQMPYQKFQLIFELLVFL